MAEDTGNVKGNGTAGPRQDAGLELGKKPTAETSGKAQAVEQEQGKEAAGEVEEKSETVQLEGPIEELSAMNKALQAAGDKAFAAGDTTAHGAIHAANISLGETIGKLKTALEHIRTK
ncbi:MAG: hypothetical protein ABSF90_10580 [Syntrophobacteraceae bacterium]